ncbi:MAG: helix-turn-helix domain-containing protein [Flammeovirgaceae bacterium]
MFIANILVMYSIANTPSKVLLQLAKRHKSIRKKQKLSQVDLAKKSGVSLGSLKRFEQIGQISLESLLKLVHVLNRLDEFDALLQPKADLSAINQLFSEDMQ